MSFSVNSTGSDNTQLGRRHLLVIALVFLVSAILTCLLYSRTLHIGFLLDDFVHLDYASKACAGDTSGLMRAFTGNWTGQADGLTSFRPGISLSMVADHFWYHLNPIGYHATNLLTFSICSVFCGALAYQLVDSDSFKQRASTAVTAAILFVVYPLHAESVSWIIGRVDLFCTVFYLASLSLYFRFRKSGQYLFFVLSLIAFLLSLISKEMAVTLPVVIAIAEVLLPNSLGWIKQSVKRRAAYFAAFAALLVAFAVLRTVLLGTLVGGYGAGNLRDFIHSRHRFFNVATLSKILFGVNEEELLAPGFGKIAFSSWIGIFALTIVRLVQPLNRIRTFAFVVAWIVVSVLPTFQIWQISPNLVGSRLFFLGSAGLCILMALILVPTFKHLAATENHKILAFLQSGRFHLLGCAFLLTLAITWSVALQHNLYPWIDAGRQMQVLHSRLVDLAKGGQVNSVILLNLPQDFEGAGMVGNEEILHRMLKPPVTDADYSRKFSIYKDPSEASTGVMDVGLLKRTYENKKDAHWLLWMTGEKSWLDWTFPTGAKTFSSNEFSTLKRKAMVACSTFEKPKYGKMVWAKLKEPLDPFAIDRIELIVDGSIPDTDFSEKTQLLWRSTKQPRSWIDYTQGPPGKWSDYEARGMESASSLKVIVFKPDNVRSWLLNGPIKEVGFTLPPGSYSIKLVELRAAKSSDLAPKASL